MSSGGDLYAQLYDRLRAQVEHENELYNQRIIWLITMQAFLYATVGLVIQARINLEPSRWYTQIDGFGVLVCTMGVLVALVADRLLTNARNALAHIKGMWDEATRDLPRPDQQFYPHPSGGDGRPSKSAFLRSGNLPKFFAVSWVVAAGVLYHPHLISVFVFWRDRIGN